MTARSREADPRCQDCRFHQAEPSDFIKFPDGNLYKTTGTCVNPESPLYQKRITGALDALVNGMHHRLPRLVKPTCFTEK